MILLLIFAFSTIKCNLKDLRIETLLFAFLLNLLNSKFFSKSKALIKFILETAAQFQSSFCP